MAADLSEAEKAWEELQAASRPPAPPKEWRTKRPTPEQYAEFQKKQKEVFSAAVEKAKEFYTKYPTDPNARRARRKEMEMLSAMVQMGETNLLARLESCEKAVLADPKLSDDERFEIRSQSVNRAAMARRSEGIQAIMEEFEKGARQLMKEFPKQSEVYDMLLMVAQNGAPERARKICDEILKSDVASSTVKTQAEGILKRMDALGKPVKIKFKALDGTEVDVSKMKGKVVLIDFWATWCGPCVAALPEVLETYKQYHPKGFEIVGISFDKDKDALTKFIKEKEMTWPQYFDGLGWDNKIGREFGINAIPAMWLIDKNGNLADMNARGNLQEKVKKYLAE